MSALVLLILPHTWPPPPTTARSIPPHPHTHLEPHEQALPLHIRKAEVDIPRVAVPHIRGAIQHHALQLRGDAIPQPRLQRPHMPCIRLHLPPCHLAGCTQAHTGGSGQRATPETPLLAAAAHLGFQAHPGAAADIQGAHPLGPIQLVPRDGHEVDVHVVDADGDLAHRLV